MFYKNCWTVPFQSKHKKYNLPPWGNYGSHMGWDSWKTNTIKLQLAKRSYKLFSQNSQSSPMKLQTFHSKFHKPLSSEFTAISPQISQTFHLFTANISKTFKTIFFCPLQIQRPNLMHMCPLSNQPALSQPNYDTNSPSLKQNTVPPWLDSFNEVFVIWPVHTQVVILKFQILFWRGTCHATWTNSKSQMPPSKKKAKWKKKESMVIWLTTHNW